MNVTAVSWVVRGRQASGDIMVSRRKILSQSRDELSYEPGPTDEPEEDVWFTKEKLYKVYRSREG